MRERLLDLIKLRQTELSNLLNEKQNLLDTQIGYNYFDSIEIVSLNNKINLVLFEIADLEYIRDGE